MHRYIKLSALILCSTLLMACSDKQESKPETVFQGQIDALEKARGVEDTLLRKDQQQRDIIDSQSR